MKIWTVDDVPNHFVEILESSSQEPQIIANQGEPVAVLVDIDLFNELMTFRHRPTMAELLSELSEIQAEDSFELELPDRQDRPNPLFENM